MKVYKKDSLTFTTFLAMPYISKQKKAAESTAFQRFWSQAKDILTKLE